MLDQNTVKQINSKFQDFLNNRGLYIPQIGEGVGNLPSRLKSEITDDVPNLLISSLAGTTYKIKGSIGTGRVSETPWVAVMNKSVTTTTQHGVYIVFLINDSFTNIYLALGIGAAEFGKTISGLQNLKSKRDGIRNRLRNGSTYLEEVARLDIKNVGYQNALVFSTIWPLTDVDECLNKMKVYEDIYDDYLRAFPISGTSSAAGATSMAGAASDPRIVADSSVPRMSGVPRFESPDKEVIYFGAPGTGKSYEINKETKGRAVIRTTFHPDSDYASFVGAYKPAMNGDKIEYKFVKQAFLKAYLSAWKKMSEAVPYSSVSTSVSATSPIIAHEEGEDFPPVSSELEMENPELGPFNPNKDNNNPVQSQMDPIVPNPSSETVGHEGPASGLYADPQFLIIEEINRGNCAQIFGDLFQLLDRADNGFSTYPIVADTDMQQAIENAFANETEYKLNGNLSVDGVLPDYTSNYGKTLSQDIQRGRILLLPSNLYIWATMNTSDQSLFPIDSAFKRRWVLKYVKIDYAETARHFQDWKLDFYTGKTWREILRAINDMIVTELHSADKQLGNWFIRPDKMGSDPTDPTVITFELFRDKVLFYLFNDVFKDIDEFGKRFKDESNKVFLFESLFDMTEDKQKEIVKDFIDGLFRRSTRETTEEEPEPAE